MIILAKFKRYIFKDNDKEIGQNEQIVSYCAISFLIIVQYKLYSQGIIRHLWHIY